MLVEAKGLILCSCSIGEGDVGCFVARPIFIRLDMSLELVARLMLIEIEGLGP